MKDNRAITLTISILLFLIKFSIGQPCGPEGRSFDKQIITPTGDLLLIYTWLDGNLMMDNYETKYFHFNYVLISSEGKVRIDTLVYLPWPERHYNFVDCKATYREPGYTTFFPASYKSCTPIYMPNSKNDSIVLGFYLPNDKKFAYEMTIDREGKNNWVIYNVDTMESIIGYKSDHDKHYLFHYYLQEKYKNLKTTSGGIDYFRSYNDAKNIKLKYPDLENPNLIDPNVYFVENPVDSADRKAGYKIPPKWTVKGKNWEIPLNGSLTSTNNLPLIALKNKRLYVTVYNHDSMSCPGYGWDYIPYIYCIDIKKGKILWTKTLY